MFAPIVQPRRMTTAAVSFVYRESTGSLLWRDFRPLGLDTRSLCSYLAGVAEAARRRNSFSPWPAELILERGCLGSKLG